MTYGYGSAINRALRRHDVSVPAASKAMGYARPDMLYKVLKDLAEPSLDRLQKLADFLNEPVGDLLPNSGANPVADDLRDVLAAISGIEGDDRFDILGALAVNARVLANAYRRPPRANVRATEGKSPPGRSDESGDEELSISVPR